jgi:hypothetical protein
MYCAHAIHGSSCYAFGDEQVIAEAAQSWFSGGLGRPGCGLRSYVRATASEARRFRSARHVSRA